MSRATQPGQDPTAPSVLLRNYVVCVGDVLIVAVQLAGARDICQISWCARHPVMNVRVMNGHMMPSVQTVEIDVESV